LGDVVLKKRGELKFVRTESGSDRFCILEQSCFFFLRDMVMPALLLISRELIAKRRSIRRAAKLKIS